MKMIWRKSVMNFYAAELMLAGAALVLCIGEKVMG